MLFRQIKKKYPPSIMAICTPKRIYNEQALESWLEKISRPWDSFFTRQELSLGREIYRNGEIRELELKEFDAIIHAKFDQEDCYTVIEWSKGKFTIRGSSDDKLLVRALAVAGLLDTEELVSEQSSPLPKQKEVKKEITDKERIISALLKRKKDSTPAPVVKENARPLYLEFGAQKEGLVFKASWRDANKKLIQALKSETFTPGDANASEREKLISLASLARKGGFKFNSKLGFYVMHDIKKMQTFFRDEFDEKWKDKFEVQLEAGVERLSHGEQVVDVEIDIQGCEGGTLDFCWNMCIKDEVLDAEQARELIRKTGEPVLIPSFGILKLEEEKTHLLATWKRWLDLYTDGKIPRYVLFSLFGEEQIKLKLSPELKNWKDSLFQLPKDADSKLPTILRAYQQQGVRWLWHLCDRNCHGLLADEMGLGKTIQILSIISARDIYNLPNLVVCPASVVPVWQKEIERYFPHIRTEVLRSGHDFYKKHNEKTLWIASYAQLRMHKFLLDTIEFGYVILDEAQLIKNPEAKVSQACMRIRGKHRIVLTGTPLENKYLDLWTIFRFLMPGLLGTRKNFEDQVVEQGIGIRDRIKKQIAPFVLRRTKADVLKELPCKTEMDSECPLTETQQKEYERLTKEGVKLLGEDIPKAVKEKSLSFLTLLTRLRQVCCDPALLPWKESGLDESGKIIVLIEKLTEVLANGHKVVIFSQFVSLLKRIELAINTNFPGMPYYQLTGKTLDRARPVNEFQNLEGPGIFLVSLRAGGTGITLHSADYVFLMDPWWNPAVEEQAIDRVHRMGQEKPVFVYRMIAPRTIESRIQKLKSDKKGIFTGILGGLNDISDIRNYFNSLSELIELLPEEN